MSWLRRTTVILTVSSLMGCWWAAIGKKWDAIAQENITKRASFEFNCDAAKIELTCLRRQDWGNKSCKEFGVTACDNRAVYIREPACNYENCTWVMNTASTEGGSSPETN
jgi:hypothetical protein